MEKDKLSEEQKIIDLENEISFLKNALYEKQKEIEELKKPKYLYNVNTGEITRIENKDGIDKNKIKEKIKELEEMELTKGDIFFKMRNFAIVILRELLEE